MITTIVDVIWFRPYEFENIVFENTNTFGFSDMQVQIVPLFYSRRKNEFLKMSCFVRSWGIFSEFRAKYLMFCEGTT